MLKDLTGRCGERKRRGSLLFSFAFLAACSFGSTLYTTSGSTSNSGSTTEIDLYAEEYTYPLSSTLEFETLGSTYTEIPFTIQLTLPTLSGFTLDSAPLDFSGEVTSTSGPSIAYEYAYTQDYDCGFFGNEACSFTDGSFSMGSDAYVVLTQISDSTNTWTGSMSSGDVDLTTLGFGSDLLDGGTLTVSGELYLFADFTAVTSTGYDDDTYAYGIFSGSGAESASLELDGTAPEPSSFLLLGSALIGLGVLHKKRA